MPGILNEAAFTLYSLNPSELQMTNPLIDSGTKAEEKLTHVMSEVRLGNHCFANLLSAELL